MFGGWGQSTAKSDGNVYVLSLPSFRWIRVTHDSDLRQRHQCHLLGGHTMLVVGGVQPGFDDKQPSDSTGCDRLGKFPQGLGLFSLNTHTWTTDYDPMTGSTPYQIHSNISAVIGGNENGGATLQTPVAGFMQKELGSLFGARPEPNNTATAASSTKKSLSGGAIAAIVSGIVATVALAIGAMLLWLFRRSRRQQPRTISAPLPLRPTFYSELNGSTEPKELYGGELEAECATRWAISELIGNGPPEKPLPPRPPEKKTPFQLQEIEIQEISPISSTSG